MSSLLMVTIIRSCSTVVVCQAPVRQDSGSIPPWDFFFALLSLAHNSAGNAQIGLKLGTVGYFDTLNTMEMLELFQLSNKLVTGVVFGS